MKENTKNNNNKGPRLFYLGLGWVLGCYTSMVTYLQSQELGLWGLVVLGTLGLVLGVVYLHNRQFLSDEQGRSSLRDRIFNGRS